MHVLWNIKEAYIQSKTKNKLFLLYFSSTDSSLNSFKCAEYELFFYIFRTGNKMKQKAYKSWEYQLQYVISFWWYIWAIFLSYKSLSNVHFSLTLRILKCRVYEKKKEKKRITIMQLFCSWQKINIITLVWTLVKCQELKDKWNCFGCKTSLQKHKVLDIWHLKWKWHTNWCDFSLYLFVFCLCVKLKYKPYGNLFQKQNCVQSNATFVKKKRIHKYYQN